MTEHPANHLIEQQREVSFEPNETAQAIGQQRTNLFSCPIAPPPPNPDMERARAHTLEWVRDMGIITSDAAAAKLDAQRHDFWSAVTYPSSRGDTFDLQNDWVVWLAMYDDYNEVHDTALSGTLAEDAMAILGDAHVAITTDINPFIRALDDLWRRTRPCCPFVVRLTVGRWWWQGWSCGRLLPVPRPWGWEGRVDGAAAVAGASA